MSVEAPVCGAGDSRAGGAGAKMAAQPLHAGRLDVRASPQAGASHKQASFSAGKKIKMEVCFSPQSGLCLPQTLWWLQSREAPECTPCPEWCMEHRS